MYRTTRKLALATAFVATMLNVGAFSPAAAASTERVSYRDLDLGTSAGQTALNARLRRASTRVCDGVATNMLATTMDCRSDAMARARADLAATLGNALPVALR